MRTFIALELPTPIQQLLEKEQQRLRARLQKEGMDRRLRFSSPHNMHLTLRFLGETTETQVQAIARQLAHIAPERTPMDLALTQLGCFPSLKKPIVLWMGVGGEIEALARLQAAIEQLVSASGFAADRHGFSPHVTLARVHRGASIQEKQQLGRLLQETTAGKAKEESAFPATHVVHFRSDLQSGGPVYTPLTTVPLGRGEMPA